MVGKGSVNHNSRVFKAKNVDGDRTENNIDYCNENIKDVYQKLFDDALKKYNAKQGFVGGSKHDTEWNQWVHSEKKQLAKIMEQYGIEWEQEGTHEKHLSVYDYEKKMRAEEVKTLEKESEKLQIKVDELNSKISDFKEYEDEIEEISNVFYEEEEYQLPDPPPLMTAKTYKIKFVEPLIQKLIKLAKTAVKRCFEFKSQLDNLKMWYNIEKTQNKNSVKENTELADQNKYLTEKIQDYKLLRKVFGNKQIDALIEQAKEIVRQSKQRGSRFRDTKTKGRKSQ